MPSETVIGINEDVLIEILVKLPPESVFRFKCVSPRWRDLLSSRSFVQRHAAAHRHGNRGLSAFFQKAAVHQTSETLTAKHCNTLPIRKGNTSTSTSIAIPQDVGHFINSSNGLILFSRSIITYHVANPLSGKFVELPAPPRGKGCLVDSFPDSGRTKPLLLSAGLICEENKNLNLDVDPNYSVVRAGMNFGGSPSRIVYIDSYSSKTGKWSAMREVIATGTFYLSPKPPVVANGVIHWYTWEGNIAVYDDGQDHVQLIGVPLAGKKNDSYAITRSDDDDDVLWLGLVRRHNLLFYKLPKTNTNDGYKRQVDIHAKEWELVRHVSTHALCQTQKSTTNHHHHHHLNKRRGLVACKKTVLECLMIQHQSEVVALLRQDDRVFIYNVHNNSIQSVARVVTTKIMPCTYFQSSSTFL